jgi:hypothetical protein
MVQQVMYPNGGLEGSVIPTCKYKAILQRTSRIRGIQMRENNEQITHP